MSWHRLRRRGLAQALRVWPLARLWYRVRGVRLDGKPDETVWYFAYGANLHDSAFRERRGMQPMSVRPARLVGYRLRFNLDGRPKGRAAPANLAPESSAEVWGVLYRITRRDLIRLDSSEGVPGPRYQHLWAHAEDSRGEKTLCVTYMADGNAEDGRPSLRYITLLREGARAHGLPADWLAHLDAVRPADPLPE